MHGASAAGIVLADTGEVDEALIARLSGDVELMALMPDGVFWDVAGAGATKFVLVSQVDYEEAYAMPHPMWERIVYLVKATMSGSSSSTVRQAAARIHALLQDVPLEPDGYYPSILIEKVQRVRYTEVDEQTDQRWQHRGGHYLTMVCPR